MADLDKAETMARTIVGHILHPLAKLLKQRTYSTRAWVQVWRELEDIQKQIKRVRSSHSEDVRWLRREIGEATGERDRRSQALIDRVLDSVEADNGVVLNAEILAHTLGDLRREEIDTPRLACILPEWSFKLPEGLTEEEQDPARWRKRLDEWRDSDFKRGRATFTRKMRLFLLCAHTYRLVPCGSQGQGYEVRRSRSWLKKTSDVTQFMLQIASGTLRAMKAAGASPPVPPGLVDTGVESAMESTVNKLEARLTRFEDADGPIDSRPGMSWHGVVSLPWTSTGRGWSSSPDHNKIYVV